MKKHIFPYQLCIFLFCWLTCMTTAVRAEGDVLNHIVYLSKSKGTVYVLLGMVSERTDFLFIYDSKVVDNERLVKIEKGSRTLRQAITEIVGIQDLELRVVGNHILINAPVKREHPMEQVVDTLANFVLEGTLLDKKNGVPIVYATVGVEGTSIGSITNQAGEFRLHLADSLRRKSLVFSHVGYMAQKIDIPLLTAGQHFTLTLEPRIFPLQEVVIRVVHPIRLMREMLEKRMINYSQKPVYFTTFYREGVQYKQKFRSLTEAVFKIYKSPVQSLYAREQVKLLKMSRITDGLEQDTLIARMSGGIDACLQLDIINHLPDFLLADAHKDVYAYTSADVTIVGDHLVNVISFEQKKEVKEPLYCGELYIDSDNGALLQAQIRIHPRYMKQATDMVVQRQARRMKIVLQELTYTISYKPWNGTYYINHVRGDLHFKVKQKRQWLGSSSLHTWFEMVTCKIDTVGVTRFQRNERIPTRTVFADTHFKYDSDFWENFNVIPWEKQLVEVIEQLTSKIEKIEYE